MSDRHDPVLRRAAELAIDYLDHLPERPVGPPVDHGALAATLGRPLADDGADPVTVIEQLAADADPGIVAAVGMGQYAERGARRRRWIVVTIYEGDGRSGMRQVVGGGTTNDSGADDDDSWGVRTDQRVSCQERSCRTLAIVT